MEFKKNDIIKNSGKFYKCIISDSELVVFGEITIWNQTECRVSYEKTFIISQTVQDGFEYELIQHHQIRVVPDSDGGL